MRAFRPLFLCHKKLRSLWHKSFRRCLLRTGQYRAETGTGWFSRRDSGAGMKGFPSGGMAA
ncbi:hypothetical protein B5E84_04810 [Lachnoclostridium sp. An14]|nr:hypothetical protein B5E84_04810 [Lachnoclostridium sp. An14]